MSVPAPVLARAAARLTRAFLAGLAVMLVLAATAAGPAAASSGQEQIIEQDPSLLSDPAGTLATFRALGANTIRVLMHWDEVAPAPISLVAPPGFDGSDPADYAAAAWAPYDAIVQDARRDGMRVYLTIAGGAPRWAQGSGIPPQGLADLSYAWKPNATRFGQFVHAVGERYDGSYIPDGASQPLPAIRSYTLWNEPNFGQDLGPQAIDGSTVSVAPMMYRALVDAGWSALQSTGHGSDTIVIGGFAAEGRSGPVTALHPQGLPGNYAQTKPLQFVRTLYCLDDRYKPLRGGYAAARGCPTNAAGTRAFRRAHPGLFNASGVADHPYPGDRSPVDTRRLDRNYAIFPALGRFEAALDQSLAAYGSHRRYTVYNDEYGYLTNPPHGPGYASPATAATYLNWSEYLSWRSPRIASYAQYLLTDPPPATNVGFSSGLFFSDGKPKATLAAYRLPVYLPVTNVRRGHAVEVWGNARPAHFMALDGHGTQRVAIQFQAGGHGAFTTVRTVSTNGYFDTHVTFARSGNVRLAYTYPDEDSFLPAADDGLTVESRTVKLTVR